MPSQVTSSSLAEKWRLHPCSSQWDCKRQLGSEVWVPWQVWAPPMWRWLARTAVCTVWRKREAVQAVRRNSHTWDCLWRRAWGCCLWQLAALAERSAPFCPRMMQVSGAAASTHLTLTPGLFWHQTNQFLRSLNKNADFGIRRGTVV